MSSNRRLYSSNISQYSKYFIKDLNEEIFNTFNVKQKYDLMCLRLKESDKDIEEKKNLN